MRRILLVEDQLVARKAFAIVLALDLPGSMMVEAGSLAEARAQLGTIAIDIAVVDLNLPDGSGLDLIPEIRAAYPHVGVVVLTASTDPVVLEQAQGLGATRVSKSDAFTELRHVIEHLRLGKG